MKTTFATVLASLLIAPLAAAQCVGDVAVDGRIDGGDLGVLLANWGPVNASALSLACDLDGSSSVNGADLGLLLSNWGFCQPSISSVSPNVGCFLGNTEIVINGPWVGWAEVVLVGGVPCTDVVRVSSTQVRAATPPGVAGPALVQVVTPGGAASVAGAFQYVERRILSVMPGHGSPTGGMPVTIVGDCLSGVTQVSFGGAAASNLQHSGDRQLTVQTPPHDVGDVDVIVAAPDGSATLPGGFRYLVVPSWASVLDAEPDGWISSPSLRDAIRASGFAWRVRDIASGIEMVLIPPGTFSMGCSPSSTQPCFPLELPVHQVTLTHAFYIGRYEVTQEEFRRISGFNPSYFIGLPGSNSRPVEQVYWGLIRYFLDTTGLRLPSEAEWEFACRAGSTAAYHNGTSNDWYVESIAWFDCYGGCQTQPVGMKQPNGFGLYDMSGNVWEMVGDRLGEYSAEPQINPTSPADGTNRVIRGGAFGDRVGLCRSSMRRSIDEGVSETNVGFRVARNP
jgi:formylglycine-generating enzyme required for sulfatase activity